MSPDVGTSSCLIVYKGMCHGVLDSCDSLYTITVVLLYGTWLYIGGLPVLIFLVAFLIFMDIGLLFWACALG